MIGQPPFRIAGFIRRPRDRRSQPCLVEFEQLARIAPQIGKLFLKRDHAFRPFLRSSPLRRTRDAFPALPFPAETIPAATRLALSAARVAEWHRRIRPLLRTADGPKRNADRPPHRSPAISPTPSLQSVAMRLRVRSFPIRGQFRRPRIQASPG